MSFLRHQARKLRANAFRLRGGVFGVEGGSHALPLPFLGQMLDVLADAQVFIGDSDLRLHAAKLDVIAREFSLRRDESVALQFSGLVGLRVGGFNLPPHMAPEIQLP